MAEGAERRGAGRRSGVFVAGGGTAGHLVPGIAVAEALASSGVPRDQIHFVGSARGIDSRMVPAAGFTLTALPGRGLERRRLSRQNAAAVRQLLVGIWRGIRLVRAERPAVVLSLGGYAALPASVGAVLWRVPLVLAEQNAAASAANRLLSRFARAAAVPVAGTGLRREVVTGNPVRRQVLDAARRRAGAAGSGAAEPGKVVVVFGGSLGSLRINTAVWDALALLAARGSPPASAADALAGVAGPLHLHHVVGERDWEARPEPARHARGSRGTQLTPSLTYRAVAYDDDLPRAMAAADLVVCRAGGSTVAELSVLRTPAVLVPLPGAPGDHQTRNAEALAAEADARIVPDAELTGERLLAEIATALGEDRADGNPPPAAGTASTGTAPTFGSVRAAELVAQLVAEHGGVTADRPAAPARDPRDGP
ncbi:MAG TPA: hypothetical protein DEP69_06710 [Acidimicrobiaceae bacterium]|nr:hypothetical protein [Acidimicrobiaceae bacterium]